MIVTTHNRAKLLDTLLVELVAQSAPKEQFEILVVNNASNDETKHMIAKYVDKERGTRLKYIWEGELGMSIARNTGCNQALGEYVAFVDDDARVGKKWVAEIISAIEDKHPDILGGPLGTFYLANKPDWYKDEYQQRGWGRASKWLEEGEYLSGSNFIMRKHLLKKLGGFKKELGPVGRRLGFGDETGVQYLAWQLNPKLKVWYEPKISVTHLVPDYKMRLKYRIMSQIRLGQQHRRVYGRLYGFRDVVVGLRAVIRLMWNTLRMLIREKRRWPFWQQFVYEEMARGWYDLGRGLAFIN